MKRITIFTCPKPFTNPHIAAIQYNAIRSWLNLGPKVEVLVLGEEEGLAQACVEMGARHLPDVKRNAQGTPLISSLFELARTQGSGDELVYINADVLLMPDFVRGLEQVAAQAKRFLVVGQRWDLAVTERLDFSTGWEERLRADCQARGRLHPRGGSDYFAYPRACFTRIPDMAIGRAGWDNWMIYEARQRGWAVVDATEDIQIVHQDHDYSHLPNSQPHYRLPETYENVRLAGGPRHIFTLLDVDYRLAGGRLLPERWSWKKQVREMEIFPLVGLHSEKIAGLVFAFFHPKKAYGELRAGLRKMKERK